MQTTSGIIESVVESLTLYTLITLSAVPCNVVEIYMYAEVLINFYAQYLTSLYY